MTAQSLSPAAVIKPLTFAIIGNPNTGKSSLFNALTGGNAAVGNYAGVTVDLKKGKFREGQRSVTLVDLPGTYSLTARSLDEKISVDAIAEGIEGLDALDGVVVVVDVTAIERNMYLLSQVLESDLPVLVVANMWDRLDKSGVEINLDALRSRLGVPVVSSCASKRQGIDEVRRVMVELGNSSQHDRPIEKRVEIFPEAFESAVGSLTQWFSDRQLDVDAFQSRRLILDAGTGIQDEVLSKITGGKHAKELGTELQQTLASLAAQGIQLPSGEARHRYVWVRKTLSGVFSRKKADTAWEDRIDNVLTHHWYGLLAFVILMFAVFQVIYSDYTTGLLSGLIEAGQEWISELVMALIGPGPLRSLINDGVIAGVGAVLVFVPQIAVLFLLFAIMEDCGYMARVAMVMDRLMSKVGLNGRAFLPLMTSFGCAVPGILATRTIPNRTDRLLTMLVAPLMSCSARLPVYTLMIYAFIPNIAFGGGWIKLQSLVLLAMLMLGVVVAIPVAWLIRRFMLPSEPSTFVLEMPAYKFPSWRVVLGRVWEQVREFVVRAGTLIFCTSVVVWALLYFPGDRAGLYEKMGRLEKIEASIEPAKAQIENSKAENPTGELAPELVSLEAEVVQQEAQAETLNTEINAENAALIRQSVLGRVGIAMEPVFRPLGWDWRIGVGVLASFPAREVIIATMGTIFSLGGDVDEESVALRENLQAATFDGHPLMSVPVALSIMVFFALCMQCAATLAVMKRESGSWKWPIFSFVYMTALAYVGALLTYQIAVRLLG